MAQTTQQPAAPAPATKQLTPVEEIQKTLLSEGSKKQFMMALPPQMPVERFIRVAITALNKTPDLVKCNRESLYNQFMLAAQDGLLPDGREAAIVPFAGNASYMPMVHGILKKIRNSGELKSIVANVVHEGDPFRYWVDEGGEHLLHEPILSDEKRNVTFVYALAKTKDDGVYITVMSKREVEEVRAVSKVKGAGPWMQWWEQMAKKTAIRRLSKVLPMSTDLDDLIRRDDDLYDLGDKTPDPKAEKGTPGRLKKLLGGPGQVIEATGREVSTEDAAAEGAAEPLVTPDNDTPAADDEAIKCDKCDFSTVDADAMADHLAAAHGAKAATPAPAPAAKNGGAPGSLFGGKK